MIHSQADRLKLPRPTPMANGSSPTMQATRVAPPAAPSLMDKARAAAEENRMTSATQGYDESKGVAGRVAEISRSGSQLMQLAETKGNQIAAQRGLTGSSLGAEAAQKAMLEAATPIATADASLFNNQALANQNARNSARQSNLQSGTTLANTALQGEVTSEQQNRSLMESARQFNAAQAQQQKQFASGQRLTREMFSSDDEFRQAQLAQQQGQFTAGQALTREMFATDDEFRRAQAEQQASQFAAGQTLTREMFSSDDEFRKAQAAQQQEQFTANLGLQARQVDAQIEQFAKQLGMSVQELQLKRDTLKSSDKQALDTLLLQKKQLAQQASQFGQQLKQGSKEFSAELAFKVTQLDAQKAQFAKQLGMSEKDLALRRASLSSSDQQFLKNLDLQKKQLAQQAGLAEDQLSEQARQFNKSQASNKDMFTKELAQKGAQFDKTLKQQQVLAKMDVASREKIAGIEADFKNDIQGSVNISNAWGTMMQAIGDIQNNPHLEGPAKTTRVQNVLDAFKGYANFWKKTSNIDVSELLKFNVVGAPGAPPVAPPPGNKVPPPSVGQPGFQWPEA